MAIDIDAVMVATFKLFICGLPIAIVLSALAALVCCIKETFFDKKDESTSFYEPEPPTETLARTINSAISGFFLGPVLAILFVSFLLVCYFVSTAWDWLFG